MEKIILNLIYDDYYSLWEVYDEVLKVASNAEIEEIMDVMSKMVREDKIVCFLSSSLLNKDRVSIKKEEALTWLNKKESWFLPTPEKKFLQVTSDLGPIK